MPKRLSAQVPECPSTQVPGCLKYLSVQVQEYPPSAQVPFDCPLRALQVLKETLAGIDITIERKTFKQIIIKF